MKHKGLIIISILLALLLYAVMCFFALFAISDIHTEYSVYATSEYQTCEDVLSKYKGKNLFFLDVDEIKQDILENTELKVDNIVKNYPSTLYIKVYSRQETYSVKQNDKYLLLDEKFALIEESDTKYKDNSQIIELNLPDDNFKFVSKVPMTCDNINFITAINDCIGCFDNAQSMISSFSLVDYGLSYRIVIEYRTGVTMEVWKALTNTKEKTQIGIEKYLSLDDEDKLSGKILCYQKENGEYVCLHSDN